jgi:Uma2 family endonuclease
LVIVIGSLLKGRGDLFSDRMRLSSPAAGLSVEPDVMYVSHAALSDGRVRLVPTASAEPGNYIELEGAADLVVEIVSDSSVVKDTRRLPEAYFLAGVREFWLADARGAELVFQIYEPGQRGYELAQVDADGFQASAVLERWVRLERRRNELGNWTFDLRVR